MRVAVSIGHNPEACGARNGNVSEYGEMAAVAGLLVSRLQFDGQSAYMIGAGGLVDKVRAINDLHVDCAVELHLNSGGGKGCETLYCPGSIQGKALATAVQSKAVIPCFRDRGVKEGWYKQDPERGKLYFLEHTKCPAIITESYFLDTEATGIVGNMAIREQIAKGICAGIMSWWEERRRNATTF